MKIQHSVRLCESCHWLYFKTVNWIHICRWWWCARWDWTRQTVSEWQPMPCLQSQQSRSLQPFYRQKNVIKPTLCLFIHLWYYEMLLKKNCQWSVLKFLNALWCYFGFTMTTILIFFFPISFVNMRGKNDSVSISRKHKPDTPESWHQHLLTTNNSCKQFSALFCAAETGNVLVRGI